MVFHGLPKFSNKCADIFKILLASFHRPSAQLIISGFSKARCSTLKKHDQSLKEHFKSQLNRSVIVFDRLHVVEPGTNCAIPRDALPCQIVPEISFKCTWQNV